MFIAGVFIAILAITSCFAVLPDNYRSLSAEEKQELQWKQIKATEDCFDFLPTEFPPPGSDVSQTEDPNYLVKAFTNYDDEMLPSRSRLTISPLAAVCKIVFNAFENSTSQFTGIFRTGGIGLIRFALDGVLLGKSNLSNFAPSVAIKIYVDGSYSHSILVVKDPIYGQQENKDYFRDTVSNMFVWRQAEMTATYGHEPEVMEHGHHRYQGFVGAIGLLDGDELDRPHASALNLGVYDSAMTDRDGTKVTKVIAPFQVLFVPNPILSMDEKMWKNDFRKNIHDVVKEGEVIYTVFGLRTKDSEPELIGEIIADSECFSSRYGDEVLFFRHPRMAWRP